MKKILTATAIIVLFIGCEKEELPKKNCNCGFIENDDNFVKDGNHYYTITVKNDCSGNSKTFYIDKGYWMNAHAGESTCFDNVANW